MLAQREQQSRHFQTQIALLLDILWDKKWLFLWQKIYSIRFVPQTKLQPWFKIEHLKIFQNWKHLIWLQCSTIGLNLKLSIGNITEGAQSTLTLEEDPHSLNSTTKMPAMPVWCKSPSPWHLCAQALPFHPTVYKIPPPDVHTHTHTLSNFSLWPEVRFRVIIWLLWIWKIEGYFKVLSLLRWQFDPL